MKQVNIPPISFLCSGNDQTVGCQIVFKKQNSQSMKGRHRSVLCDDCLKSLQRKQAKLRSARRNIKLKQQIEINATSLNDSRFYRKCTKTLLQHSLIPTNPSERTDYVQHTQKIITDNCAELEQNIFIQSIKGTLHLVSL